MKVFDKGGKVNFVDKNNVLVGYDMNSSCCEEFGWYIRDEITLTLPESNLENEIDLDGYNFDTEYLKEEELANNSVGVVAIFKIMKGNDEKYIHLFNIHNGYNSHGFAMEVGDKKLWDGYL